MTATPRILHQTPGIGKIFLSSVTFFHGLLGRQIRLTSHDGCMNTEAEKDREEALSTEENSVFLTGGFQLMADAVTTGSPTGQAKTKAISPREPGVCCNRSALQE